MIYTAADLYGGYLQARAEIRTWKATDELDPARDPGDYLSIMNP